MLSPARLLIAAAGLAIAIIATLLLLNWWMVSCGRLSCDLTPAWAAQATTPDSCPPDIKSSATDPTWAKGIYDNLPDWQRKAKTTGRFFADGIETKTLISGQGSRDNPDELWVEATKLLAAAPIKQPSAGLNPAASHVETKAAVWMRHNKITYVVAVINNREGPCGEFAPDDPFTCITAIRAILPMGSTMVVWWLDQAGQMRSASYEGMAT